MGKSFRLSFRASELIKEVLGMKIHCARNWKFDNLRAERRELVIYYDII